MTKINRFIFAFMIHFLFITPSIGQSPNVCGLLIQISNIANSKGQLIISMYDNKGQFP